MSRYLSGAARQVAHKHLLKQRQQERSISTRWGSAGGRREEYQAGAHHWTGGPPSCRAHAAGFQLKRVRSGKPNSGCRVSSIHVLVTGSAPLAAEPSACAIGATGAAVSHVCTGRPETRACSSSGNSATLSCRSQPASRLPTGMSQLTRVFWREAGPVAIIFCACWVACGQGLRPGGQVKWWGGRGGDR